jgi:hypothetical protein
MEPHSNLDHSSPAMAAKPAVSVAVHGATLTGAVLHPQPVDGEHSLAEMAQRDLDAALQLLADRAQYITGASGAAIALRRDGKKDMLCRASSGSNAPELGALLSTEFGLSGESVRTRQPLRCDDAERDLRVNREVCRQMGIASVVVMPVVNDDEVLGVFELFSGKANAFGARDLSAVQRLSEMVETAVRLAHATKTLPERLKMQETSAPESKATIPADAQALDAQALDGQILAGELLADIVVEDSEMESPVLEDPASEIVTVSVEHSGTDTLSAAALPDRENSGDVQDAPKTEAPIVFQPAETASKKKLFWSAAMNPAADAGATVEPDQSHVPPMLRSLRKCAACGFPVSAGRMLCVECEEKKWRGQLRVPRIGAPRQIALPNIAAEKPGASGKPSVAAVPPVTPAAKTEARAFAAAAQTTAPATTAPLTLRATVAGAASSGATTATPAATKDERAPAGATVANAAAPETKSVATARASSSSLSKSSSLQPSSSPTSSSQASKVPSPEFILSAALEPSQSWLAAHKYFFAVLLVVGGAVAAVFLLR